MSKTKKCKVCGVSLTKENKYHPKTGHGIGRICRDCHKKDRRHRYKNLNKKFIIKMIRGDFTKTIEFSTFKERHDFIQARRIQSRYGRCKISTSSRYKQTVWYRVFEKNENGERTTRYVKSVCDECGSEILYSHNNFQICSCCGLVHNEKYNILTYETTPQASRMHPKYRNGIPVKSQRFVDEESSKTLDRYYAKAYSKRLR